MTNSKFPVVGAVAGLIAFLAVGLLPSVLYGGYAGVLLATGIVGAPLTASYLVKALVVLGMVMGVTSAAFLSLVLGAVSGALLRVVLDGSAKRLSHPVERS